MGIMRWAVLLFLIGASGAVNANPAVTWLAYQAQADGSYSTAADVATPFQATAETLTAFASVPGAPRPHDALAFLNSDPYTGTEQLSRRIVAGVQTGYAVDALVAELASHQNEDGGFGELAGCSSSVQATAHALAALGQAGYSDPDAIASALGFLMRQQRADGGFADGENNDSSVYLAALVLDAVNLHSWRYDVGGTIQAAARFLQSRQHPNGMWDSTWETALALKALARSADDAARYSRAITALSAAQLRNGSWDNDVFATALAAGALQGIRDMGTSLVH